MNIDKDVLKSLKMLAASGPSNHQKLKTKHDHQTQRLIETQLFLLSDEVARVVPRDSKLFEPVLMLTAISKVVARQQEPEFKSYLEEGVPEGF